MIKCTNPVWNYVYESLEALWRDMEKAMHHDPDRPQGNIFVPTHPLLFRSIIHELQFMNLFQKLFTTQKTASDDGASQAPKRVRQAWCSAINLLFIKFWVLHNSWRHGLIQTVGVIHTRSVAELLVWSVNSVKFRRWPRTTLIPELAEVVGEAADHQ